MLTPEDIQSREFLVSLRGYDRDEVHAFLDEVAEEFGTLLQRVDGGEAAGAGEERGQDAPTPASATPSAPTAGDGGPPASAAAPEPTAPQARAGVDFAQIGAETQRILEVAQEAADSIRRRAEEEAAHVRDERLAEAQQQVDALLDQAAAVSRQIDDLTSRREELAGRLRQARETVELALLEIEPEAPAAVPADASTSVLAAEAEAAGATEGDDGPVETPEPGGGESAAPGSAEVGSADAGSADAGSADAGSPEAGSSGAGSSGGGSSKGGSAGDAPEDASATAGEDGPADRSGGAKGTGNGPGTRKRGGSR